MSNTWMVDRSCHVPRFNICLLIHPQLYLTSTLSSLPSSIDKSTCEFGNCLVSYITLVHEMSNPTSEGFILIVSIDTTL